MSDTPGAGRLDPETLAAYIDGLLPDDERAKVEAEIAADPESYEWVVSAMSAVDDESVATPADDRARSAPRPAPVPDPVPVPAPAPAPPEKKVLPFYRRRTVQGLGALLLASAAALVLMVAEPSYRLRILGEPDTDPLMAKLVEAVGEERYIEARLTGGFKFGPMRQAMRGPSSSGRESVAVLAAAAEIERRAQEQPTAAHVHAAAVADLLTSMDGLDDAIRRLEDASRASVSNNVYSDLGAAYFERWRRTHDKGDLDLALQNTNVALLTTPSMPEALYNKALILSAMGDAAGSRDAWRRLTARSLTDPWARASRERAPTPDRQKP